MISSFEQSLNQLASLRGFEYLSTTPGLTGRPILDGKLYVHIALSSLLRGHVHCPESEKAEIQRRVAGFLEENTANFRQKDLPALTQIEYLMRRLHADQDHVITGIYSRIWNRFSSAAVPIMDQATTPDEGSEEEIKSKKHFIEFDDEEAPSSKRRPPQEEQEPASTSEAASSTASSDVEMIPAATVSTYEEQPATRAAASTDDEMTPAQAAAAPSHEHHVEVTSPTTSEATQPASPSSAPRSTEPVIVPDLSPSEFSQALRETNTSWFLSLPLTPSAYSHCKNLYHSLYKKSVSSSPLSEEEWILLARCAALLVKEPLHDDLSERAQEIFFRYYLCHDRKNALPEELLTLLHRIAPRTRVLELVSLFRTASLASLSGTEPDPNATVLLKNILDNISAVRWQEAPISLTGFASATPWRTKATDLSDQQLITELCRTLSSLPVAALRNHLDEITLVLLSALSSHTFRGNESFRESFKKLEKQFTPLVESFRENPPQNAAELEKYKNFFKLHNFFIGSAFETRLIEEEHYKSPWAQFVHAEKPTAAARSRKRGRHDEVDSTEPPGKEKSTGRYTLWGAKDRSGTPAGNRESHFDIPALLSSLEEVRQVAIRESRRKKDVHPPTIESLFTLAPAASFHIPSNEKRFPWEDLFHEPTKDAKKEWVDGQEQALMYARQIADEFTHFTPQIDFEAVVKAAERGGEELQRFLHMYSDQGLTLLRDYVYPYVVLMKRATTSFDQSSRKFIGCAASPKEILSLCEEDESTYVAVLRNVLGLMRKDGEDGPGGALKDSVIHTNQIGMLSQMIRCIQSGKTVFICNETGSGKTTMSKLAPHIVSFHVPVVLHVAPFTQLEKGWERLTSWKMLDTAVTGETSHFWITAADLAHLMAKGIPQKYQHILRKTFFLMDEYDSQEYVFSSKDEDGLETQTSVQDELFFRYNCPRVVNMSATPNLETFETLIVHYRHKIERTDQPDIQEHYRKKISVLVQQRDELLSNMALEWERNISLQDLPPSAGKDSMLHIRAIFNDIKAASYDASRGASLLVEVPQFTLSPEYAIPLHEHMHATFSSAPSAILFRDTNGYVQAHHTQDGTTWEVSSLEEFAKLYSSLSRKPIVVCMYSQDSVGGDFDIFSNERLVRAQYIVYADTIAPSYAIFQNMRRQRRNISGRTATRERAPSETPVTFYLGPQVSAHVQLSSQEQARVHEAPPETRAQATNALRKEKLLSEATRMATYFSRVREQARLKRKVIRKKQLLLKEVLKEDAQKLSQVIESECREFPHIKSITAFFQSTLLSLIEDLSLPFEADIEEVRSSLLSQAIGVLQKPILSSLGSEGPFQENEALCLIQDIFGGPEGLEKISESADVYAEISRTLTKLYRERPRTCVALFKKPLETMARQKRDPILHPVPSSEAIATALRRLRLGTYKGIPDVAEDIDPGPERPGVAPLPPDIMVKALIGTPVKDQIKAKRFCQRLGVEVTKAHTFQKAEGEKIEQLNQLASHLKKTLLAHIEPAARPSIVALAHTASYPSIKERAHQLDLYMNTYRLYTQTS